MRVPITSTVAFAVLAARRPRTLSVASEGPTTAPVVPISVIHVIIATLFLVFEAAETLLGSRAISLPPVVSPLLVPVPAVRILAAVVVSSPGIPVVPPSAPVIITIRAPPLSIIVAWAVAVSLSLTA